MNSQDNFYLVKCSDWESVVSASTHEKSVEIALKDAISNLGDKLNLSFIISSENLSQNKIYEEIELEIFNTSHVLHDIGFFSLAKNLDRISDFFLDKGQKSY